MLQIGQLNRTKLDQAQVINFKGVDKNSFNKNKPYLLAFDLDGTFLECNKKDMEKFVELAGQKNFKLAYVSGRLGSELDQIIEEFAQQGIKIPVPDYFFANNGQFLYEKKNGQMQKLPSEEWNAIIKSKHFNRQQVMDILEDFIKKTPVADTPSMLQFNHRPSDFNVEYLVHNKLKPGLEAKLNKHLKDHNINSRVILDYVPPESVAKSLPKLPETLQTKIRPMLDKDGGILALHVAAVNKADAVEFLHNRLNIDKNHVITAGNGGNDISMAVAGFWFIVVNNAQNILKEFLEKLAPEMKEKVIQATRNGAAGINEGLEKIFATVDKLKSQVFKLYFLDEKLSEKKAS